MKLSRNFKVLPPTSWTTSRRAVALKNLSKFRKAIDSLIHVDHDDDDDDDDDDDNDNDNGNDNHNDDHHPTTITTLTLRVAMTINLMEICIFVLLTISLILLFFLGTLTTSPQPMRFATNVLQDRVHRGTDATNHQGCGHGCGRFAAGALAAGGRRETS